MCSLNPQYEPCPEQQPEMLEPSDTHACRGGVLNSTVLTQHIMDRSNLPAADLGGSLSPPPGFPLRSPSRTQMQLLLFSATFNDVVSASRTR